VIDIEKKILLGVVFSLIIILSIIVKADYCMDNATISRNVTINGELNIVEKPCDYGCDLNTNSCNPAPYQQNMILLGIIIIMSVGGGLLIKWARR